MAKRKPDEGAGTAKRLIKVRLTTEEFRSLRIAAAIRDCRPSEFVRAAAIAAAEAAIKAMK